MNSPQPLRRGRYWLRRLVESVLYTTVLWVALAPVLAEPFSNPEFNREQRASLDFDVDELLRIWIVYVGQGDGVLIQLPPKYNYDPDPNDNDPERTERVDVLVDGGPKGGRLMHFVNTLYAHTSPSLEYVVITHHDGDHIHGITTLLEQTEIPFGAIYHNGLASYTANKPDFTPDTKSSEAVVKRKDSKLEKGMAFFTGVHLQPEYVIDDKTRLLLELDEDHLHGLYKTFASAVQDNNVLQVARARVGHSFIAPELSTGSGPEVEFQLLWPLDGLRKYGGWAKTINGNSVTFRLKYGDFEMLFTGDLNKKSQPVLLEALKDRLEDLQCDVLKIPHHGSHDAHKAFFQRDGFAPVLSVASMGSRGFTKSWRHPSTDVIQWLGGFDRVYHTFIHEGAFDWDDFDADMKQQMTELSHVLIETDGEWFRLVEIDAVDGNIHRPPTVAETRHSNGTLWIKAQ